MTRSKYFWLLLIATGIGTYPVFKVEGQNGNLQRIPDRLDDERIRQENCQTGSGGNGYSVAATETRICRVSAFCACNLCCPGSDDGITADGHRIRPGDKFVAAPKSIPFGALVTIPEYSTEPVPVRDRGILIDDTVSEKTIKVNGKYVKRKTADFDVFFFEHDKAVAWGIKILEVTIHTQE